MIQFNVKVQWDCRGDIYEILPVPTDAGKFSAKNLTTGKVFSEPHFNEKFFNEYIKDKICTEQ